MVLEITAGRLIARYLGSSLYTWTSVIGVVLAGIAIGNYLGGRVADRCQARKTLAVLFAVSSFACAGIIVLNKAVGSWEFLWQFNWPVRVFCHVSSVFLIPSTLLGMISPVVAKMALDRGLATGRTIGAIYAWGAAGSIAGTFLAGFYLIAVMGTIPIFWTIGGCLLVMAILHWATCWPLRLWVIIFVALMTAGLVPTGWAESLGSYLALRGQPDPDILYEDESQYCYISVRRVRSSSNVRRISQDNMRGGNFILMNDSRTLVDPYMQVWAIATHSLSQGKDRLSVLAIGGGGYIFPRYVEQTWPGSRIDVAEIDPGMTRAAMEAFGLQRNTTINTIAMDARNYVDELLQKGHNGDQMQGYDFIYGDAFNNYGVPYHLATKEFNDKIAEILKDDGLYMLNVMDIYEMGRFLGAVANTFEQTFADFCVVSSIAQREQPSSFVFVAAKKGIDTENLFTKEELKSSHLWLLSDSDIDVLKEKAQGMVLTDDYAPVENLLLPVVSNIASF